MYFVFSCCILVFLYYRTVKEIFSQIQDQAKILKWCKFVYLFKKNMPIYNLYRKAALSANYTSKCCG